MKKCDFCGKETDDYKVIKELDNQIMCQECIEKEIDVWREAFANVDENDTPYDYGYGGGMDDRRD